MLNEILGGFIAAQLRFSARAEEARRARLPRQTSNSNKENNTMSSLTGTNLTKLSDGFEGFNDRVEGDDEGQQGGGVIKGVLLKFTNDSAWLRGDGEEMPEGLELVAVDIARVVQKWVDKMPEETRILAPGEPFPDIEQLNEETPRSEWSEGFDGKPKGPWQSQSVVYLLNLTTFDRFTYATGTIGGGIAVRELVDRTRWMRRLRGDGAFPVVLLSKVHMNTRFGGRDRPFFQITRWVKLGSDVKTLEAPQQSAIEATKIVEPTMSEILSDELPDFGRTVK
jgi:hypothetical protein